jgi:N-acetylmuramoyl-L-alanine amidase
MHAIIERTKYALMLNKKLVTILPLIFVLMVCSLAFAQDGAQALYQKAHSSDLMLRSDPARSGNVVEWERIISSYKLIIDSYPNDPIIDDIIFIIGGLYQKMYEQFGMRTYLNRGIENYHTVLRDYPESYLQEAAMFAVGEIQELHLKAPRTALETYSNLILRFPKGYRTTDAKRRVVSLERELGFEKKASTKTEPIQIKAIDDEKKNTKTEKQTASKPVAKKAETVKASTKTQQPADQPGSGEHKRINGKGGTAKIVDIRSSFNKNTGRVVVELDREISYYYKQLPGSNPRIYFDLDKVNLNSSSFKQREIPIENKYLNNIRLAQFSKTKARMVLDFSEFRRYSILNLPGPGDHFRIVFDLYNAGPGPTYLSTTNGDGKAATSQPKATDTGKIGNGAAKNRDGNYSLARQLGAKINTIVIDPGHGGKDPGAIGFDKHYEKIVNLDVAKRIKKLFESEYPSVKVKLTRDNDKYISLDERPAKSRIMEGDIFVSLHANATAAGKTSGIETYYLNFATDKQAQALAAKENAASSLSQAKLGTLIRKIMSNSKKDESKELSHFVQTNLVNQTKRSNSASRDLGVKSAPFVVLIGTDVPSVLVEMGYVNHKIEGRLLMKTSYRNKIARGVFNGLKAYIESLK